MHASSLIPNPVECFLRRHCEARHAPKQSSGLSPLLLDRHAGKSRLAMTVLESPPEAIERIGITLS
jgi:hypothetical protein